MSNDSPIHYWDPKRKKWFYYDDAGEVCIETDIRITQSNKKRRSPIVRIDELANELDKITPRLETLIEYIKGIAEVDQIEIEMLQGEIDNNTIPKDRLYDICILRAIKFGLKYSKRYNVDLEDTIQNALLGACQAIKTYTDGPFVEHLKRSVREEVMNGMPIGEQVCCLPWGMKPSIYQILQQAEPELLEVSHSAYCSSQLLDAIKQTYHCNSQIANNLASLLMEPLDIDTLIETEDYSLSDNGLGEEELTEKVYQSQVKNAIDKAILTLKSQRAKEIVYAHFGFTNEPMTCTEIGREIGLTRERIRQIVKEALKQLRHPSRKLYLLAIVQKPKKKRPKTITPKKDTRPSQRKTPRHVDKNKKKKDLNTIKEKQSPDNSKKTITYEEKDGTRSEVLIIDDKYGTRTIVFNY